MSSLKFPLLISAIGIASFWSAPASADPCEAPLPQDKTPFSGAVSYIVDGDGLCVGHESGGIEVRLGDFNAPELSKPGGAEAKAALRRIAFGRTVTCTPCEGARNPNKCITYDRVVATCRLNGKRLGDLMRAAGIEEGGH